MNPEPLVIATGNAHKYAEIAHFLDGIRWPLRSLADYPPVEAPLENGDSFEANALLKARYYAARLRAPCLADDSGIMVDALNGAPGIFSARYAGQGCSDDDNNAKLLRELAEVADTLRSARFVCCAALAEPDGRMHVETGIVEGRIAAGVRGNNGFGYDPLFIPEGHGRTFGELDPSVKAGMSHRFKAFGKMRAYLETRQ